MLSGHFDRVTHKRSVQDFIAKVLKVISVSQLPTVELNVKPRIHDNLFKALESEQFLDKKHCVVDLRIQFFAVRVFQESLSEAKILKKCLTEIRWQLTYILTGPRS